MAELSILIPARNEKYLKQTIEDIFQHAEGDTEVIVGIDGDDDIKALDEHFRGRTNLLIFTSTKCPIGQRAMTNELAKLSEAKYVMKIDAHCSFSQGFDVEMIKLMQDDITMTPILCRLDAEQWKIKPKPRCVCYRFNKDLIFDYWHEYEERDRIASRVAGREDALTETLALQGSCWLVTREKYWELELGDPNFGNWGQQGVEVALKTWLSGGRVVTNRNAFYGHLFRGLEEFPYERDMSEVDRTKDYCKELFTKNLWPKQKIKLEELLEKFKPIPDWHS